MIGTDLEPPAILHTDDLEPGTGVILPDGLDPAIVQDRNALLCCGLCVQNRFEIDLITAVRRFRGRPAAVWSTGVGIAVTAARNVDPGELIPSRASAKYDIVGIIIRQTRRPDLVDKSQTTKRLHGARCDVVALDAGRRTRGPLFDDHDTYATPREIKGQ